ncbi:MAG TPA: prolyl oligopeptidase family serine peptidase [Candidatus Eisenbacteria bacterium]
MPHAPLPIDRVYLARSLSEPAFGADPDDLFFVQSADGRRSVVRLSLRTGLAHPVTTEPAPTGGIGYGGGLFAVRGERLVYAGKDGRLHGLDLASGRQRTLTPPFEGVAAPAISPCGRFVAFLAEQDARCNVFLAETGGGSYPTRVSSDPWYAFNPTFSGDGARLAWQEWGERDMPWDEASLRIARFAAPAGAAAGLHDLRVAETAALGSPRVSRSTPLFTPDGTRLAFTSDETGWRSLWIASSDGGNAARIDLGEGEIGRPDWVPGQTPFRFSEDGRALFVVRRSRSRDSLWRVPVPGGAAAEIPTAMTRIDALALRAERLALLGSSPTAPTYLATLDLATGREIPRATSAVGVIAEDSLSRPEVISWRTGDGADAWGVFYPATGPEGSGPRPTMVLVHGGPTSEYALGWYLGPFPDAQYFATRGWHVLCVNHRGGTGYGRAYQEALRGRWGEIDQDDYRSGAQHLIDRGLADRSRMVITGGSAGGYATLLALTRDPEFWTAGVSFFGIGNLHALIAGSHRFEVHYEQGLIGPLPQSGDLWRERSPLTHVARVRAPVLLFHGTEDKAVPHAQSVEFAEAVRRQGGVAELVSYEGEGHGFVREETRRDAAERMERFLERTVLARQR